MRERAIISTNRVIVADHDAVTSELIAELLAEEGFAPLCYPSWLVSVQGIEQAQANLLILELQLGDPIATLNLLVELRRNPGTSALPVIVNSTNNRLLERVAEPLRDLGCVILQKPFGLADFFSSIRQCLDAGPSHMNSSPT